MFFTRNKTSFLTNSLWTNDYDKIFFASKKIYGKKSCIRRHWISWLMRIKSGDVQTVAPTYRNYKKGNLSFWCNFWQRDSNFIASKRQEKFKSSKLNSSSNVSSLAKKGARTFNQNFVCLKWEIFNCTDTQANRQTNMHRKLDQDNVFKLFFKN